MIGWSVVMKIIMVFLFSLVAFSVHAKDKIELDEIEIQGASELPKVLYIVPWKRSVVDESPVEVDSMVDQVMTPVDQTVLRRQLNYYEKGVFGQ
jgi:hypothetical protein